MEILNSEIQLKVEESHNDITPLQRKFVDFVTSKLLPMHLELDYDSNMYQAEFRINNVDALINVDTLILKKFHVLEDKFDYYKTELPCTVYQASVSNDKCRTLESLQSMKYVTNKGFMQKPLGHCLDGEHDINDYQAEMFVNKLIELEHEGNLKDSFKYMSSKKFI